MRNGSEKVKAPAGVLWLFLLVSHVAEHDEPALEVQRPVMLSYSRGWKVPYRTMLSDRKIDRTVLSELPESGMSD